MQFHIARCIALTFTAALIGGCGGPASEAPALNVDLKLDPSPPQVGDTTISLSISETGGAPVEGATVRVEGNMNHAGMKPSFADLTEGEPGQYYGSLNFTMGGDWFLLVDVTLPDGKKTQKKIDVPGVKSL